MSLWSCPGGCKNLQCQDCGSSSQLSRFSGATTDKNQTLLDLLAWPEDCPTEEIAGDIDDLVSDYWELVNKTWTLLEAAELGLEYGITSNIKPPDWKKQVKEGLEAAVVPVRIFMNKNHPHNDEENE